MVATILQPDLDLTEYPNDEQNIVIAFESYGLTKGVMSLQFAENPIGYITDADGNSAGWFSICFNSLISLPPAFHCTACASCCLC
jgi:hypothetical protein